MQAQEILYKEIKTFEYTNMIVRVHIPDISDEEKKRKMKQIAKATEALLKTYKKNENRMLH